MMNKSRYLSAVIAAFMSVAVAGCGESGAASAPVSTEVVKEVAPVITVQPKAVDLALGSAATFNIEATGPNLKFQWKKGGVAIPGAVSNAYTLPAVSESDAGASITVTVSNAGGAVESQGATVSVYKSFETLEPKGYLTQGQVAVSDLLPNETVGALSVSVVDGPDVLVKVGADGIVRYLSPEEQNKDTVTTLAFKDAGKALSYRVSMPWSSRVGSPINEINEGGGESVSSLSLLIDGGVRDGYINDDVTSVVYKLQAPKQISAAHSEISIENKTDSLDATSWFDINPVAGTLTLKVEYLPKLKQTVKDSGFASLVFSLSTENYESTYGFESGLQYVGASLTVKLVDDQGAADLSTVGDKYVVTGLNSGLKVLATVTDSGEFVVSNLPIDTYSVEEVLLEPGTQVVGFYPFDTGLTDATLKIVTKSQSVVPSSGASVTSFTDKAESSPTRERERLDALNDTANHIASNTEESTADYTVSTRSGKEGQLRTVPVDYTIPSGATEVGVEVIVKTDEFPKFTKQSSEFNDVWQFSVSVPGLPVFARTGKVNQTHSTDGEITVSQCFKLGSASTDSLKIGGQIGAQNVGDSMLATSVTVNINRTCGLAITAFTGVAKSAAGTLLLYPRKFAKSGGDGNINGQYLSLPISGQLPSSFAIPSVIKFTPEHAVPTEVELFVRSPKGAVSLGKSYLQQGVVGKNGIEFKSLSLGAAHHEPTYEAVELVAVLTATVDGRAISSKPTPITIDDKYSVFTPIYLAESLDGYSQTSRYGTHNESGGDSWGTQSMHSWLAGKPCRYNDLSAANVGQTAKWRSVLDHSGHSDGQQVDVRYADGAGGFTDELGGANKGSGISALANAAKAEVDGGVTPTPNLDKLRNWIRENRDVIDKECDSQGTRRVYVGNSFIYSLLNSGVFPGTSVAIPGVGTWTTKSSKVKPQEAHLDHWHINRQ